MKVVKKHKRLVVVALTYLICVTGHSTVQGQSLGGLLKSLSGATQGGGGQADQDPSKAIQNLMKGLTGGVQGSGGAGGSPNIGDIMADAEKLKDLLRVGPVDRFYLGRRGVASRISGQSFYPPSHPIVRYVRSVLGTIAMYSRMPYAYRGYILFVVDDPEVNLYVAPGGIVLVYRGMLDMIDSEDELALLLAHELAHVELDHGFSHISMGEGRKFLEKTTGKAGAGGILGGLLEWADNGYGVDMEVEADYRGVEMAARAGYDPRALVMALEKLKKLKGHYGGEGYPPDRAAKVRSKVGGMRSRGGESAVRLRTARFQRILRGGTMAAANATGQTQATVQATSSVSAKKASKVAAQPDESDTGN
jgi:hypothetical protein